MSETESANAAEGARTPAETTSEATPSIEWIRDFARRWIDAWNSHEVDRLLALMSEDIPRTLSTAMTLGPSRCEDTPTYVNSSKRAGGHFRT
jgi:hypothetical protein